MNPRNRLTAADESADRRELSRVADLRSLIAGAFATEIVAAMPLACATLHNQFKQCRSAEERNFLRYADHALSNRQEQVALQVDRCVSRRFDAKVNCPGDAFSHTGQFSLAALSMMEELGMQEEFEIEQCVIALREKCQVALLRLTTRLRHLLQRDSLPESHSPVFVRVMLRGLMDAFADIGCDAGTRRAALRAFAPLLPRIMHAIYARADALLAGTDTGDIAEVDGHHRCMPQAAGRQMATARL